MGNSCVNRWVLEYPTTELLSTTNEIFSKKVFDTATSGEVYLGAKEQGGNESSPCNFLYMEC